MHVLDHNDPFGIIAQAATLVEEAVQAMCPCPAPQAESCYPGQMDGCGNGQTAGWEMFSASLPTHGYATKGLPEADYGYRSMVFAMVQAMAATIGLDG